MFDWMIEEMYFADYSPFDIDIDIDDIEEIPQEQIEELENLFDK